MQNQVAYYINLSVKKYHPFGMPMPGRQYTSENYRFGFNGQEKDDEIAGQGNNYTAEFWQYDSCLGRRWNLDPKPNTSISSYGVFANNPILFNDPFGDTTSYYNIKDGSLLGIINNPGSMRNVKITTERYTVATTAATSDPEHQFYGYLGDQTKAQGLVNDMEWNAKRDELITGNNNLIAFETGNYALDFTGKVITREELNGRTSGGQPLATIGKMHLQTIFDDGSRLTVESFNFSSGHFGNGPLPNYTSTVQNGYQVGLDGKARPIWALVTPESGMRLNSGALGWKLRLPVYRGIRGGLLIHPDCNTRGTAGCIGIRENDATLIKLGNFFDNYIRVQQRTLIIFHHIPNNPNYGNSGNGINTGKE